MSLLENGRLKMGFWGEHGGRELCIQLYAYLLPAHTLPRYHVNEFTIPGNVIARISNNEFVAVPLLCPWSTIEITSPGLTVTSADRSSKDVELVERIAT